MNETQRAALDRLFDIAINHDSGGAGRVANFLMAWWNARDYGGFDFTDFWQLDDSIVHDCMTVLQFVARARTYLDECPEYKAKFHRVHALWREPKKKQGKRRA